MNAISVGELRQNPTRMLDDVERGESYVVTRHGREIARIVPVTELVPPRKQGPSNPRGRTDLPRRSAEEIDELVASVKGEMSDAILRVAESIAGPLKALDAIHVATAIVSGEVTVATHDRQMKTAIGNVALPICDPV